MKFRRFFTVFFCLLLMLQLTAPALAAQDDLGDWDVAAKAALLADPDTGELLYARISTRSSTPPASLKSCPPCWCWRPLTPAS